MPEFCCSCERLAVSRATARVTALFWVSSLLRHEVLLQLRITDPTDEQAEQDGLALIIHLAAAGLATGQLHATLSCFRTEVSQEALDRLAWFLSHSLELCGSGLPGLLGDKAVGDVVEDLLLRQVLELGAEAAIQHLGHTLRQALTEPRGVVTDVLQPFLVLWSKSSRVMAWLVRGGLLMRKAWGPPSWTGPGMWCELSTTSIFSMATAVVSDTFSV